MARSGRPTREARMEALATSIILAEALPRLLRLVPDEEAEANALLEKIQQKLDYMKRSGNVDAIEEATETETIVYRIVRAALREEATTRIARLGNDGTP